jgi:hypothetical protein
MKTYEPLLRKPEIKRDEHGRFEQHGAGLIKKAQSRGSLAINKPKGKPRGRPFQPGQAGGPGRPKGSLNKTTKALKDMILGALDKLGGEDFLVKTGIENNSAFMSILGKVLPTTLAASESSGGARAEVRFVREIVYPGNRREIEGVTPKSLPAPDASQCASQTD